MWRIRVHGRGGQGVVTTAELLSIAAFRDGHEVQAFPSFGSERMGAPVTAYCRISDSPIRTREVITVTDALIIADSTLLHQDDLFDGLTADGFVLVNSSRPWSALGLDVRMAGRRAERLRTIPATVIARNATGRPVPNAPLIGAFAALTGAVSLSATEAALRERFPADVAKKNILAARTAHEQLRQEVPTHA